MKHLLFILIGTLLLPSCNMRKYCDKRYPPMESAKDSVSYVERIIYRDTTIYFTIPADTVYQEVYIDSTTQTAHSVLRVPLAFSVADYSGGLLRHTLIQNDSAFTILLQNAIKEHSIIDTQIKELKIPYEVNKVSKWQNFQMTAAWILLMVLLGMTLWKNLFSGILPMLTKVFKKKPKTK